MSVEVNLSLREEWNIVSKIITTFTPFRVVFHSKTCCPSFNSLNEWEFTRLLLEACRAECIGQAPDKHLNSSALIRCISRAKNENLLT